jgi:hypothetical protein
MVVVIGKKIINKMWNTEDKNGFEFETLNNRGQINIEQDFGKIIFELSSNPENKILVDIGTWNGLGSTKCFIEGMKLNKSSILYTIENNEEKYQSTINRLSPIVNELGLNVNFVNGTLINNDDIDNWLVKENIILNENEKYWLLIDKSNSKNLIKLDCQEIDVLLIDGSEFSGYLEMILLKDISNYILLDDVNSIKNKYSREYLLKDENFELISEDLSSRNGYSIFKKIKKN